MSPAIPHLARSGPGIRGAAGTLLTVLALGLLAGCGSSGDPNTLLKQTFSGAHSVRSGNLSFSLSISPSGSTTITSPLSISFGGPFQSRGTGQLPLSDFNLSFSGLGRGGSVGILSTGTNGYVTLQGASYQLPPATFQRLESSFSQVTSSGASRSSSGGLSRLGINPLRWLTHPQVVGQQSVGGTATTHIRAGIDVNNFLTDLNTFLQRASTSGVAGSSTLQRGIPPSTRQQIASQVQSPTFDVWTGNSDKTMRRLELHLNVPVTGQVSTLLGGLRSASFALSMQYSNLNQPQSVSPPTSVRPFSEFQGKLQAFLASVRNAGAAAVGSGGGSNSAAPGASGSAPGGSGSGGGSTALKAYSACLQAAGQDVTKIQSCGSLLSGH